MQDVAEMIPTLDVSVRESENKKKQKQFISGVSEGS